ncbi:MAG: aldo/keto reductase [Oscillospiraceae bacterium]|nr:aldo/keto reductase [Oscillospiraceae bacterium]
MNKLGFGFLRLPQAGNGDIDWPLLETMVDEFLASGGTYFDTAYTYLDGISETALKRTVAERYPRDCFRIADKLPSWKVHSCDDCDRYFQEQLMRCGVDYFDVYLLHWLNQANYMIAERYDEFDFLNRLKADGKVGKTGFSYHGDAATLEKILQTHPDMDVVQLQINYLDWDDPAMEAHKCYDIAARYGKEIVVMEPVKGGTLANLPEEAARLLRQAAPDESAASWAIRFAQSLEQVSVVLSGMNTMEQIQDNMRDLKPLSTEEYSLLKNVGAIITKNTAIPCTACRYCVKDCPKAIAIPDYFRIYNAYCRFPAEGWKMEPVYAAIAQTSGKASDCIQCHKCERNCPQQIPVTEWLTKVAAALE